MIEILPSPSGNLVKLRASGQLTKQDYDRVIPMLETHINKFGKLRLYCEVENLEMPSMSAIWQDVKFDVKHYNDFTHVAVIGEPEWLAAITKLAAPMVPAEVRVFKRDEKDAALLWLTSENR